MHGTFKGALVTQRQLNAKREERRRKGEVKIRCSDGRTIGSGDFESKSIHVGTLKPRSVRSAKQAKQRQNRLSRAALYQDYQGEAGSKNTADVNRWHTALKGLSLGTVG